MESNLVQNISALKKLPKNWRIDDFKSIVEDNSGGNKKLAKSDFLKEGVIAIVDQGKELVAGFYNDTSLAVKNTPPYIVFGDHTRIFKYVNFPFIMGADGTKILQPKSKSCNTKYLYYFFRSINVPNTGYNRHFKYLKNLKIPLPPLPTQKKIAAILDTADQLRQLDKKLIQKYEELSQSLFLDMFGDQNLFEHFPISEIAAKDKYSLSSGPFGSNLTSKHYTETGIIILRGTNVTSGSLDLSNVKYVSEEKAVELKRSELKPGDVVIVAVGSSGKALKIPDTLERAIMSQNFNKITPDKEKATSLYLEFCFNSQLVQNQFKRKMTDTVRTFLSLTKIRETKIPIPALELQLLFEERIKSIEAQKVIAQQSLQKSEDLFNSLLQKAFKGALVK